MRAYVRCGYDGESATVHERDLGSDERGPKMAATIYRLDQQPSGVIAIDGTRWQFWVITLLSMPENTPIWHTVIFGNLSSPGDLLRKSISGRVSGVNETELVDLARTADAREVLRGNDRVTIRPPSRESSRKMWSIVEPDESIWRHDYAIEKSIGELSEEDVRRLITR